MKAGRLDGDVSLSFFSHFIHLLETQRIFVGRPEAKENEEEREENPVKRAWLMIFFAFSPCCRTPFPPPSVAVDFSASSASLSPSSAVATPGKLPLQSQTSLQYRDDDFDSRDLSSISRFGHQQQQCHQGAVDLTSSSTATPSTPATPNTPASGSDASDDNDDDAGSSYWHAIDPDNDDEDDVLDEYEYCNTVSELDLNDTGDAAADDDGEEDDDAGWWDQLADDDEYWRDSTPAPAPAGDHVGIEVRCSA
ncbi:uncharacterized protein IWZ02DRAFT_126940 [Phyllosticta citriasiana]|uniref:uncharacterized protein n=1 Tax=Phyllosticta citriasiana TaxID=595635 RepID=UPI0030FD6DCA